MLSDKHDNDVEVENLCKEIDDLKSCIAEKNARIEKLNVAKLTKEQAKHIQKIKVEHKQFKKEIQRIKKELIDKNNKIVSLTQKFPSNDINKENVGSSASSNREKALEEKLRKYATYCHSLESDKESMMDLLRGALASDQITLVEEDIVGAVSCILQQLREAEDE